MGSIIFYFSQFLLICQCSLAAGRLTSGLTSITSIVSIGAFVQAVAFILLLLNFRLAINNFALQTFMDIVFTLYFPSCLYLSLPLLMQHNWRMARYSIHTLFGCFIGHWRWSFNDAAQCFAWNVI